MSPRLHRAGRAEGLLRRFEEGGNPKVVLGWIDRLAAYQSVQNPRHPVEEAPLSARRQRYAALVGATAARAGAVDHDLALAQRNRAAVEQTSGTEAVVDARHSSERGEQQQRRDAGRHDAVEHRL